MHMLAALGTALVSALVVAPPLLWGSKATAGPELNLAAMESIEAELAMKSEEPDKQPKKVTRTPDPVKDETIGGDANAKAQVCKTDADCEAPKVCRKDQCVRDKKANPEDEPIDLSKFQRYTEDDDAEVGDSKPVKLGSFDGSEFGWAPTSKGDPYYIELVKVLREHWEYPEISSDEGTPVGCLRLEPDGKISDTLFKEKSGNPELDDSVERAMSATVKIRNENPVEVPTHLLQEGVTTKWFCMRFKPKAS
jgi:hypothetical protein